ncbi:hypothetical protein [Fulvivirga imtechensis]|uniref:hypothetical protein n=1 Tax=Fulvivirga imtechensis TaxID=881893 RepID=UPI00058BC61E|nr:hypothetical protein [Fulvivirga imtechensis]
MRKLALLSTVLTICLSFRGFSQTTDPCEKIVIEKSIVHTSFPGGNGSIEISIEGGEAPFTISVIGDRREKNKLNIDSTKIDDLLSGKYLIVVQDNTGCRKEVNVEIK